MSVYKRGERWYYYIKVKGERMRGAIPEARTKYQAERAETKIRNQVFEGKYGVFQSTTTLREFVEKTFLPWAKDNKRSWRNDMSRIKPILSFFGSKRLKDISPFEVEKYKIARSKTITKRGSVRSKASVNRELQLLSRVFSLAIKSRDAQSNPCLEVEKLKGEIRRNRYLLPEEEEHLMSAFPGKRAHLRLIVLLALHTGMRRGEILRLTKQDIDFHRGNIHVTKTKIDEDRDIPMNATVTAELTSHCARLESEYLFLNPKSGKPIADIKNAFTCACKLAGIEGFRFHDLRHTASTRMGEAGVDPFTIAAIMGHKDIKTTSSYTHATIAAKRQAVAALEREGQSGPQMGHTEKQRPVLTAVG
jgi:integrase